MPKEGGWQKKESKAKEERRSVLPGFPINEPFNSTAEVNQYFSEEEIVCLLCGKSYRALRTHLIKIHGCTVNKYKEMYRIPSSYGLLGRQTRERLIEFGRSMHESGKTSGKELGARVKDKYLRGGIRTPCKYKSVKALENDPKKAERLKNTYWE